MIPAWLVEPTKRKIANLTGLTPTDRGVMHLYGVPRGIDELDLAAVGFAEATPAHTGRPAYHPSTMLEIYLYGYQNRIQSSRRLGIRRRTVEYVFGTLKSWMGSTHFLTKALKNVRTEMSLCVLAYNMKRMIQIMGIQPLIAAIRT
jgi:hypothetical protein